MRRILSISLVMVCVACSAEAAPCYGTRMPKQKEVFFGVQTHVIAKRYLEHEYGKVRSTQNFALLSYGVFDWLSIDLKGGAGNIKQRPADSDEIDYPSGFDGGYGLRIRLFENEKVKTSFGFQHISVHPREEHLGATTHEAILDDWQVSLLASSRFARVTPYVGLSWSRVDYIHRVDGERKRWMSDRTKNLSGILGCDISITEQVWLNLEAQAFGAEAYALSLNYAF